ncbi:hypothetical protein [Hymenobacter sp. BT730]|uniref:hypothetical protein n=1 Tax=Hymenobacter sp. BT730 TaxID=3063332 RepID=UPI0026E017A5|nr:hypothetical protein [Hymenobacter sp. BT730]
MKYYLLLLTALFGLSNCQKDPAPPLLALPGSYYSANEIVAQPIRMYTQQGEVRNDALIDDFIRREYQPAGFPRTNLSIGDSLLLLTIPEKGPVTLVSKTFYKTYFAQAQVSGQTHDSFALTRLDSITQRVPLATPTRCAVLMDQMEQAPPSRRCFPISSTTGYAQFCWLKQAYAIGIRDGQLFLPVFNYLVKSDFSAGRCMFGRSGQWNLFNSAIRSQLLAGDTLVVQMNEVALLKK